MFGWLLICAAALGLSCPALAGGEPSSLLVRSGQKVALNPQLSYRLDPDGSLSYEAVRDLPFAPLPASEGGTYSFGFNSSAAWFKLNLHTGPRVGPMLLEQAVWYTQKMQVWLRQGNKIQFFETGSSMPQSLRPIAHQTPLVPLAFASNQDYELILRIESEQMLEAQFWLWPEREFWDASSRASWVQGILMGGFLFIFFYNLVLAFGLLDRTYVWYGAYLLAMLGVFGYISGYAAFYLFPQNPELIQWLYPFWRLGVVWVILSFVQSFSLSKLRSPRWHRVSNWALWVFILWGLSAPWVTFAQFQIGISLLALPLIVCALGISLNVYRQGYSEAKYVALAATLYALMYALVLPRQLGWTPQVRFGLVSGELLALLDVGLFGLGLSGKFRRVRQERRMARQALLSQATEHAEQLENKVAQRTEALQQSQTELLQANQAKERIFSILAHDLRGPIGTLYSILRAVEQQEIPWEPETRSLAADTAQRVYGLLENLLSWAQSQRGQLTAHPESLDAAELLLGARNFALQAAQNKGLSLLVEPGEPLTVEGDRAMMDTVLRNLIANAIKFTPRGGQITLSAFLDGDSPCLEVKDTGLGMNPAQIDQLYQRGELMVSTLGTEQEPGTGFGLMLVWELLEKNQAHLKITSQPGQGCQMKICFGREENSRKV
ncbi:MAG: sensor histidine kinase [bacterium]|nr:sensor histidine kinase [bacterium]